jgi:hypothetical protein
VFHRNGNHCLQQAAGVCSHCSRTTVYSTSIPLRVAAESTYLVTAQSVVVLERHPVLPCQRNESELSPKSCIIKTVLAFLINQCRRHRLTLFLSVRRGRDKGTLPCHGLSFFFCGLFCLYQLHVLNVVLSRTMIMT